VKKRGHDIGGISVIHDLLLTHGATSWQDCDKTRPEKGGKWRAKARSGARSPVLPHISDATGFDLFREINGSGTWTEIQSGISSTTTSYTDAAVSNGDTYIYLLTPYVTVSGIRITGANADSNTFTMPAW
jgi:hypothetical protein